MRGVMAVDVERRFGFGVAELLRVGEDFVEIRALEFHAGQDVIAGAVDDAVETGDAIADQPFAQHFDDRDAAGDAGFVVEVCAVLLGDFKQLFAVRGEQCFVGGDDRFAQPQCVQDHFARGRGAAHQFDNQVDVRVLDDAGPIGRKQ